MKLILDIVKNGKNIPSKRNFHFEESGGNIGRNEDNDWVLTDTNSYISGMHAQIICKDGTYFIKDVSTNGTYLKNPYKKLPKGHPIKIKTSDVFIIGDHELQARYSNNDYTSNDIIESFEEQAANDSSIIPDDDFLFENTSKDFISIESELSNDIDVMEILETPSVHKEDGTFSFVDILPEEETGHIEADFETKEEIFEEHVEIQSYVKEEVKPKVTKPVPLKANNGLEASIEILETKLGIEITSLEQEDRNALMTELGDIISNTLDSLKHTLQVKNKIKQDLHLSSDYLETDSSNPIHLGSSASKLLQNKDSGGRFGMMTVADAIVKSFNEIDTHSIALHSASSNLINIAISKFSPKNLENKFESIGALRGIIPRQQLLWKAYSDMFNSLNESPAHGRAMISEEFKKEYENISYSLKLTKHETSKGV